MFALSFLFFFFPLVPDGAAEQDGVLEDDGQARPERLQRQLGDVDVVDYNPAYQGRSAVIIRGLNTVSFFRDRFPVKFEC